MATPPRTPSQTATPAAGQTATPAAGQTATHAGGQAGPGAPQRPGPAPKSGFAHLRRTYLVITGIGGFVLAVSLAGIGLGGGAGWSTYVAPLLLGTAFVLFGRWGLGIGSVLPVLTSSYNLVQSGKLAEASALLDTIASNKSRSVRAAVHLQRAFIAVRRGDLPEATRQLDALLAMPPRWIEGANGEVQRAAAHGIRAWTRAATGDLAGAEEDIAKVRSAQAPGSAALAHASLAEALMLERAGERAKLAALLRRDQRLLLASLDMRERSVVRAMQRMLRAPATTVYRTQLDPKKLAGEDEPPIAEWVDRVTPELAPFLPRQRARAAAATPPLPPGFEASPEALREARKVHDKKPASMAGRVVALWALLIGLFLAVWQFLEPDTSAPVRPRGHAAAAPSPATVLGGLIAFTGVLLAAAVVRVVLVVRRARALTRKLVEMEASVARGEDVAAPLAELARAKQETIAAQAEGFLGTLADRRGDLAGALAHFDAARGKLRTRAARSAAAGFVTPGITANRAYTLAALGRADEAAAELAQLPPDYLFLARMRFVVPLVAFLARGDIDGAGRLALATSPDLSVGARDELMRDLVHAVTSPAATGAGEMARLREEIRDREETRRWIEKVAPALLARFEHVVQGHDAVADGAGDAAADGADEAAAGGDAEGRRDAEAEREAHAEAEAEAGALAARRI